MTSREFFAKAFADERPRFVRVLRALPGDRLEYTPHPRSTPARNIAWLLATELHDACELVDHGQASFAASAAPASLDEIVRTYERHAAGLQERLGRLPAAAWEQPAKFLVNGQVAWESPLGDMLWGFLFDAIHHRGQLSTYIRPMGGKVPSIYGPSGDDPGQ